MSMKKVLFPTLILFLSIFLFLPKEAPEPPINEDYFYNKEFNLITIHQKDDPFFTQKIHSMIDQEYDNYQIHIIVNEEEKEDLKPLMTYAQKMGKRHLLSIKEKNSSTDHNLIFNDLCAQLSKDSYIISLDNKCTFIENKVITILNKLFHQDSNAYIFSNFTNYPSYQKNKTKQNYADSHFKACKASNMNRETKESNIHYIDESLYLLTR